MPTLISKINGHNRIILKLEHTEQQKICNCLVKENYLMSGLYLTSSNLFQATIKSNDSNYKKKDAKVSLEQFSKKAMQTTKYHST